MSSTNVQKGIYWGTRTGTWHYEFRVAGRKRNGDTGHVKKSLALEYVAELRVQARREADGLVCRGMVPSLDQALDRWAVAEKGSFTEKHILDRVTTLRRHCAPVLNLPLNKLDTDKLDGLRAAYLANPWRTPNWSAGIEKERTAGGWNRVRRHLMALMNWCVERNIIEAVPFRGKPLKCQEKVPLIIWPEDVWMFLAIVDGLTGSQDLKSAVRLQLQLGLRENEALTARWEGFVERMNVYRPDKTKNREAREIALPPGFLDYLKLNHSERNGLLLASSGKAHGRGFTKDIVALAGRFLGIDGLHPHSLRATFATAHWEAGTPLSQITAMLGHSDPKTTMGYINQRPRDASAAQKRVFENMGLGVQSPVSPHHKISN